jgi:PTS system nitrogen regulatory IIA component
MQIADFITVDRVLARMRSTSKDEALTELGELVSNGRGPGLRDAVVRVLKERERLASTGIGEEIAIPHGKLEGVDQLIVGLGRSPEGVEFEAVDGKPTRLFFVLVAPENSAGIHLKALARISRLCKGPGFPGRLLEASTAQEMYEIVCSEDARQRGR